jgi:hypothetical protein
MTKHFETQETSDTPLSTFDIDTMATTKNIVDMYQDGNFVVCTTDTGIIFRQHIPVDKVLNKKEGKWVLEPLNYRA